MSGKPSELHLAAIAQVGIMVKDLEASTAFYRDKLGMPLLFSAGGMAFFDLAGIRLMLGQAGPEQPPGTFLYYKVDDIHAAHAELLRRGVTSHETPELAHRAGNLEIWLAFLKDPDGNLVALMSQKTVAA
jgi:catechol 2,3-dioxygenase-like lactoylglutathione lyase family enzyme